MGERSRVILAFALICLIWGTTWLAIKVGLETIPPLLGAGIPFVVASLLLLFLIRLRGVNVPWNREARSVYLAVALTAFSVPYGLVYWGEKFVSSGLTAILFAVYPFAVALFAWLFLPAERLTPWKIGGIVLGFAGIVAIFADGSTLEGGQAIAGMAAVIASAVLQAWSVIILKKKGGSFHPFATTFVPMAISGLLLLAASAALEDFSGIRFTGASLLSIVYLGIFGSVVTFVSYFWLLKRVEAVYLSLTAFITPVLAVCAGILFLDEAFSLRLVFGAALVLAGLVVANGGEVLRRLSSAR